MTQGTSPPPGDPAASARREAEVYRQLRDVVDPAIEAGVRRVVDELEWVGATNVRIVWSPPWNPGMIARDQE